jgi:hypothetical protein
MEKRMSRIARPVTASTPSVLVGTLATVLAIAAIPGLVATANADTAPSSANALKTMFGAVSPAVTKSRDDADQ